MVMIEEIARYLEGYIKDEGYTYKVYLNWLDESKPSVAVIQKDSPVVSKEYINGSRQCEIRFLLLLQDKHSKRSTTLTRLSEFAKLFDRKDWQMSQASERRILKGEINTPSLQSLTANDMSCFKVEISLEYKEDN